MNSINNKGRTGKADTKYVILFSLCFLLLGFFSSLITGDTSLYGVLEAPPLSPPPELFPIAWSILYILIGGTAGAVYSYDGIVDEYDRKNGLLWSYVGFLFNLLWYPLYFGRGQLLAALVDIAVILLLTIITFKYFYRIKKLYAYLLIPYIAWLVFAFYLNLGTIILN